MTHEHLCFCELAPLHALGLLSAAESEWVEQQLLACPELGEEWAEYQEAAGVIGYAVEAVPLPPTLKGRLFERLKLDAPPLVEPPPRLEFLHFVQRSQDLQWRPHLIPGVEIAIFHSDSRKREIVGLLKAKPGVTYPFHRHAETEEIYILQGDLVVDDQVYRIGDYLRSGPGSAHAPHTVGGCMFYFRASMDNEYPELGIS
jgi:ChrR Cupin-like domain